MKWFCKHNFILKVVFALCQYPQCCSEQSWTHNFMSQIHCTPLNHLESVSMANFSQEKILFMQEFRICFHFKENPYPYFGVALPSHKPWFALQSLNLQAARSREQVPFDLIWCSQNVGWSVWTAAQYLPSVKPCVPRRTQNLFKNFTGKRNVEKFF